MDFARPKASLITKSRCRVGSNYEQRFFGVSLNFLKIESTSGTSFSGVKRI